MATYTDVGAAWGGVILPPITTKQAIPLFAKLVKKFGRHPDVPGVYFTVPGWGRRGRRVWASPRPQNTRLAVYANGGLRGLGRMVHDASHFVFERAHPKKMTHSSVHAALERDMVLHVIAKGWHLPKAPKPKPAKPTPEAKREIELARTLAGIKRWQTKAKRAATALRKLERRRKRLQKTIVN